MIVRNAQSFTVVFFMSDSTDATGRTAKTGLTPTVQVSKNGGAFATVTPGTPSEIANGWYQINLSTTETNTNGPLIIRATGTGADEWRDTHQVSSGVPANVLQWNNAAIAIPDTAGYPKVTIKDGTGAGELDTDTGAVILSATGLAPVSAQLIADAFDKGDGLFDPSTDSLQAIRDRGDAAWAATPAMHSGTAQAGTAATITLAAGASSANNIYNRTGIIVTGPGAGVTQERLIIGYVGATKVATVDEAWVTTPDNTSTYEIGPARTSARQAFPADGSITSATFGAGAIDANAIAPDSIGSELAASAVTEIQSGLATSAGVTSAVAPLATAAALTTAQADLDNIQTRLPAALVGGKIDASVDAIGAGGITSATFAPGAIDAAAIATDAIDADALAASAVTEIQTGLSGADPATIAGAVWSAARSGYTTAGSFGQGVASVQGNLTGSVGSIAIGGITTGSFTAGAIDAAAIAPDAIGASELATDAITEIQSGLATAAGVSAAAAPLATAAALTTAQADLDDMQTRLPAVLVAGRMDANVGAMGANTLTAAAAAPDLTTELQAGLATAADVTAATANLNATISSRASASALAAVQADTDDLQARLPAALSNGRILAQVGGFQSGALGAAAYAADAHVYTAKSWLVSDTVGTADRWLVAWFKDGAPVASGVTDATIHVIKSGDGSDLFAATAMTEIGATGVQRYTATGAARITAGAGYLVIVTATLDGASRLWYQPIGVRT